MHADWANVNLCISFRNSSVWLIQAVAMFAGRGSSCSFCLILPLFYQDNYTEREALCWFSQFLAHRVLSLFCFSVSFWMLCNHPCKMLLPSRLQGEICVEKVFAFAVPQNITSSFYCYAGCIWRGVGGIPSWLCRSRVSVCDVFLHSCLLVCLCAHTCVPCLKPQDLAQHYSQFLVLVTNGV